MTERLITALDGVNDAYLAECQAAREKGAFVFGAHKNPSRFWEPFGYVALIAIVLATVIVAPALLRQQPSGLPTDTGQQPGGLPTDTGADTLPDKHYVAIIPPEYWEMAKGCIDNLEDAALRFEIAKAFKEAFGYEPIFACVYEDGRFQDGEICYGAYSGCYIFLSENDIFEEECITIDEYSYWWPTGMNLRVYAEGSVMDLRTAYSKKLLSKDDLAALEEAHKQLITVTSKIVYQYTDTGVAENTTAPKDDPTDLPSRLSDLFARIEADYLAYHVEQNGFDPTENPPLTVGGYYGTFNGAVVVMMDGFCYDQVCLDAVVADSVIHYGDSNTIQVWKNGVFYELNEAYERGLLTKNDVKMIAVWHNHNTFLTKEDIRRATALLTSPDAVTRREIEDAFARQNRSVQWPSADTNWYGTRCYGQFGSVTVLFEAGMLAWIETKTIAGVEFTYSSSFGLWGYYNGSLYTLQEAYDNGYITKEQVAEAAANHSLLQRLTYMIPRGMDLP